MSAYVSEKDQIADMKEWLAKYGWYIFVAILFVVVYIFVSNYLESSRTKKDTAASVLFDQFISSQNHSAQLAGARKLVATYPRSMYADLSNLYLAADYRQNDKNKEAYNIYKDVYNKGSSWKLLNIVALDQMLRTQAALGEPQKAYDFLMQHSDDLKKYGLILYELQGDLLVQLKKYKEANLAYQQLQQSMTMDPALQQNLTEYLQLIRLKQSIGV
jgi:predicted negative regulator of RcsB-dependent stress response